MLNFAAERKQTDGLGDIASAETALHCTDEEDRTRQEFREETDINTILRRFGVGAANSTPPLYGDVNFDINLQDALFAINETRRAYETLPEGVRAKYPTWQLFLEAVEKGTFETPEQETARRTAEAAEQQARRDQEIKDYLDRNQVTKKEDT